MTKFDADRLRTQLKLTKCRLENLLKQHHNTSGGRRREIANYLQQGQEERARVNVKYLIRDDYLMEAYEMLLTCCDDLIQSVGLIAREKTIDPDLITPAKSLVYAAGRIEAPELDRVKEQLEAKYGKQFVDVNTELGKVSVDPTLVVKLSVRSPDTNLANKYMAAIAQIFNVEWTAPPEEHILDKPVMISASPFGPSEPTGYGMPANPPPYHPDLGHAPPHLQSLGSSGSGTITPPSMPSMPPPASSPQQPLSPIPDFDELARRFQALKDKS